MRILIDTNVLYDYYGRQKLFGKDNKSINNLKLIRVLNASKNEVSLSSVSIVEVLVMLSEETELLQDVLKFILEKKIHIINNGIYTFTLDELRLLASCEQYVLKLKCKELVKLKIYSEGHIGVVLLSLLLQVFLLFYFEREEQRNPLFAKLDDIAKSRVKGFIHDVVLNKNFEGKYKQKSKTIRKGLAKAYALGGKGGSPLKASRILYNNFITVHLAAVSAYADNLIRNYFDQNIELDSEKALNESKDAEVIFNNLENAYKATLKLEKRYRKTFSRNFIEDNINEITKMWKQSNWLNDYQIDYALRLITTWFNQGVKAEKNDILDFLIIGCLSDQYLLTFDKDIVDYLESINHKSVDLIRNMMLQK